MKSDRMETQDTFDGFRTQFGSFLWYFLAPGIKVRGNSFLTLGLFSALLGQLFKTFWTFLNSWDLTITDSYLAFENRLTHCILVVFATFLSNQNNSTINNHFGKFDIKCFLHDKTREVSENKFYK